MDLTILDSLSLEELKKFSQIIDARIHDLQTKEQIREIYNIIERDGYYLTTEQLQGDVPLQWIGLRYNVDVSTFDRDCEHDLQMQERHVES